MENEHVQAQSHLKIACSLGEGCMDIGDYETCPFFRGIKILAEQVCFQTTIFGRFPHIMFPHDQLQFPYSIPVSRRSSRNSSRLRCPQWTQVCSKQVTSTWYPSVHWYSWMLIPKKNGPVNSWSYPYFRYLFGKHGMLKNSQFSVMSVPLKCPLHKRNAHQNLHLSMFFPYVPIVSHMFSWILLMNHGDLSHVSPICSLLIPLFSSICLRDFPAIQRPMIACRSHLLDRVDLQHFVLMRSIEMHGNTLYVCVYDANIICVYVVHIIYIYI